MVRKKRGGAKKISPKTAKTAKAPVSSKDKIHLAWKNLILFLVIALFSFIFYLFSSADLLKNFFGIVAIIFGFLAFAFLIVFIVLFILKKSKK
ncbi:MAG TPA: hypothetical protein VMV95_01765 [Bacillota bacterium]|nr:hypothetical protein [Bacillota bacterium]